MNLKTSECYKSSNNHSWLAIIPFSFQITLHIGLFFFFIVAILLFLFIIRVLECQGHHLFLNTPRMITPHILKSDSICSLCIERLLIIRQLPHQPHPLVHCPAAHLEPKDPTNIYIFLKKSVTVTLQTMKEQHICVKSDSLRFLYCGNVLFYPAHSWMIADDRNTRSC